MSYKKMKNYELYSWVLAGTQRVAVIKVMDKPKIPRDLSKESKISSNDTSRVLRSFVKKGIAVCLNEESKKGRLYQLTKSGKAIREEMTEEEKSLSILV